MGKGNRTKIESKLESENLKDDAIQAEVETALRRLADPFYNRPEGYKELYKKLIKDVPFTYTTEGDMKDCVESFLSYWYKDDGSAHEGSAKAAYDIFMFAYIQGASHQRKIDRERIELQFRRGLLSS